MRRLLCLATSLKYPHDACGMSDPQTGITDGVANHNVRCQQVVIYWAVTKRQSAVVKLLLEYGANPNARTTAGRSVLQEACFMNDPTSVRILLEVGADIDSTNLGSVYYI
jgi:hypothetical protein